MLRSYIGSSPRNNSLIKTNRSFIPMPLRRSRIGASFNECINAFLFSFNRSLKDSFCSTASLPLFQFYTVKKWESHSWDQNEDQAGSLALLLFWELKLPLVLPRLLFL